MVRDRKTAPAEPESSHDALVDAVNRVGDELSALQNSLDQIREDLSWVTRNGLPVQPVEHVIVKRMALDPCDPDWVSKLEVIRLGSVGNADLDSPIAERVAEAIGTAIEGLLQGQLEIVLAALDGVRSEILSSLGSRTPGTNPVIATAPNVDSAEAPPTASTDSLTTTDQPRPAQGRLF